MDRINRINKRAHYDQFYALGRLDENNFKKMTDAEIENLILDKKEINIGRIVNYFKGIRLAQNDHIAFWKVPNYGIIKLKSGNFVKVKYDLRGPMILDLTNNIKYLNFDNDGILVPE